MAVLIWTFLISYLILFVICYIVAEFGQTYFYDEATPGVGLKVALGALILAAMLTWTRSNFATMFTSDLAFTALQAIVWAGVFILIFRFQPWHGFGLSLATMLIVTGTITIGVDSMLAPKSTARIDITRTNKPIRRPAFGSPTATPTPGPAPK